ncbi:MAG: hypothetical protein M1133_02890 [Armatimonadetes bacterium]|nr:hypothetical protein [Armatimonadota bacterium]
MIIVEAFVQSLPFPILGIDSDNGSQFINGHLYRYCERNSITLVLPQRQWARGLCFRVY